MGGGHAAPGIGGVHDVVVDERRHVQQVEDAAARTTASGRVRPPWAAEYPTRRMRAQPLAAVGEDPGALDHRRQQGIDGRERGILGVEEAREGVGHGLGERVGEGAAGSSVTTG